MGLDVDVAHNVVRRVAGGVQSGRFHGDGRTPPVHTSGVITDMIGRRLAHYDIAAHLGSGGMGDVYQATDSKLGRTVALKLLPNAFAGDPDRVARFAREAKTLASLNHPNIAAIHGLEEAEGASLPRYGVRAGPDARGADRRRPLPLDEALATSPGRSPRRSRRRTTRASFHRDLKPANVKITPDGPVKVLDFGLAKLVEGTQEERRQTSRELADAERADARAGVVLGTAAYMAPEQAKGRPVDQRADLFAFGCVLYEMLAGQPAFEGESVPDILSCVLQQRSGLDAPTLERAASDSPVTAVCVWKKIRRGDVSQPAMCVSTWIRRCRSRWPRRLPFAIAVSACRGWRGSREPASCDRSAGDSSRDSPPRIAAAGDPAADCNASHTASR